MDTVQPIAREITAFTITTPDLDRSVDFYKQLGFREVLRSDWPFPLVQVSDDTILLLLRKDKQPYIALSYYVKNIDDVAGRLKDAGITFIYEPRTGDMLKRYIIGTPEGIHVSLIAYVDGFTKPTGRTMLQMEQSDYFNPDKYTNKVCGMFGEFACPVTDLEASLAYWAKLGFTPVTRFASPYPWAIVTDGEAVVGLHQSTHFKGPAITYFAADMPEKINALMAKGMEWLETTGAGSATLNTPEGQQIFLHKLGM